MCDVQWPSTLLIQQKALKPTVNHLLSSRQHRGVVETKKEHKHKNPNTPLIEWSCHWSWMMNEQLIPVTVVINLLARLLHCLNKRLALGDDINPVLKGFNIWNTMKNNDFITNGTQWISYLHQDPTVSAEWSHPYGCLSAIHNNNFSLQHSCFICWEIKEYVE